MAIAPGLDAPVLVPYLGRMATRLLLTLLALLGGLAAQFAPAQARACVSAETEIGALAGERAAQPGAVAAVLAATPSRHGVPSCEGGQRPALVARAVPTVLPGIDRARE